MLTTDLLFIVGTPILFISSLAFFVLYTLEYRKNKRLQKRGLDGNSQALDNERYKILQEAAKTSQSMVEYAELDSIRMVADTKVRNQKLAESYQRQLADTTTNLQQNLTQEAQQTHQEFKTYMDGLKHVSEQSQLLVEQEFRGRIGQMLDKLEQNITDFSTKIQESSIKSIELELRAARQLIDNYKQQQLSVVDENIIAILENALALVLSKKLTLKDQMDIVYEALEKAKAEKIVV